MSDIKELERSLLNSLAEPMGQHGFEKRPKGQSFFKKTSFGRVAFHLSFIKHANNVDVTADVAIRFDEVEDLVNQHNDFMTAALKRNTFTLGAELGNISGVGQKRWTLAGLDDVEPVTISILNDFSAIGIPYVEAYSNSETALEALSGDDNAARLHMPLDDARAMRAVAMAFLVGNRNRFLEIAAAKTAFLTSRNHPGLSSFLQLRDALELRLAER